MTTLSNCRANKNACDDLQDNSDREDIKDCCKWIMKIIVRAGLALVITKENTYTRDLYPLINGSRNISVIGKAT